MKPKSPFTQSFSELPGELPLYVLNNALLPGGELPLELSRQGDLAMCLDALKSDQLLGIVQRRGVGGDDSSYRTGCAGRIRQYRERKDGSLNLMLSGICRFRVEDVVITASGFRKASVDWRGFENDMQTLDVDRQGIDSFEASLRRYFASHNMQVDWKTLNGRHIEEVVNNLVLVINLDAAEKQRLLESPSLSERMTAFAGMLDAKTNPIAMPTPPQPVVN